MIERRTAGCSNGHLKWKGDNHVVTTQNVHPDTRGHCDVHQDTTPRVAGVVVEPGLRAGTVTTLCPDPTGGMTSIEHEGGALEDRQQVLDG